MGLLSRGLAVDFKANRKNKLQRTFVKASDAALAKIRRDVPPMSKTIICETESSFSEPKSINSVPESPFSKPKKLFSKPKTLISAPEKNIEKHLSIFNSKNATKNTLGNASGNISGNHTNKSISLTNKRSVEEVNDTATDSLSKRQKFFRNLFINNDHNPPPSPPKAVKDEYSSNGNHENSKDNFHNSDNNQNDESDNKDYIDNNKNDNKGNKSKIIEQQRKHFQIIAPSSSMEQNKQAPAPVLQHPLILAPFQQQDYLPTTTTKASLSTKEQLEAFHSHIQSSTINNINTTRRKQGKRGRIQHHKNNTSCLPFCNFILVIREYEVVQQTAVHIITLASALNGASCVFNFDQNREIDHLSDQGNIKASCTIGGEIVVDFHDDCKSSRKELKEAVALKALEKLCHQCYLLVVKKRYTSSDTSNVVQEGDISSGRNNTNY